ncbi:hypothetical protein CCZ01_04585 [Helicobacter monodelphidis]|uniref:bactofilin family protein n=1 Tax=Helicobacter sp. 15-1451 TaxID=2004995 RepID=UPI000DCC4E56|nr:polymer-forming cytoskeletal protein [Helicobacter sp. 15-1451]RAX57910.1 hypothetical protein CCZ01_04585 [Helicobacter sp. 15-1451]
MAMFSSNDKQVSTNHNGTTIIAAGTTIKGEILAECNLHIDGNFEGKIHSSSNVTIGKGGVVGGEITADKLIVSGKFNGTTDCNTVEVMPNGRIDGHVITNELVIEREGFFVGESRIKGESNAFIPPTQNNSNDD